MSSTAQNLVDEALDRQKQAWLSGSRPSVEDLLRDTSLPPDADVLLDFIYNEVVVREELGETPSVDEYVKRYPQLDEDLRLHFEVHRAVSENLLDATNPMDGPAPDSDSQTTFELGPRLADYEIVGELGRGGMGIVYKARHRELKRFVALKMFHPGRKPTTRERVRFRVEAEAIARLRHVNIVQIFDIGEEHGLPYIALELADRGTLQNKLNEMPYEPRAAAELIETLARAIHHAHDHHVIHRDLKPTNVLIAADGAPKITDFGLAKVLELEHESAADATRSGEPIGTPRYMAPEQAWGHPDQIGPETDVYSLGTMLYECLTGQAPFVSANVIETVDRIRHEQPVPPRKHQRKIPHDLETICLRCLHKEPARRYVSAQDLAKDLHRFLNNEPIHARRTPLWERAWMWSRRRPAQATMIAVGIALLFAGSISLAVWDYQERARLAQARIEVAALVKEGQAALAHGQMREAKERFQAALAKVQAQPSLRDHELGVRGWLDHSHREAQQQLSKQRKTPPLFDERRDEAFTLWMLSDPRRPASMQLAHDAATSALEFTIPDDRAWRGERETLAVLLADIALRDGKPADALARLDANNGLSTPSAQRLRAEALAKLGRDDDGQVARTRAAELAPAPAFDALLAGVHTMRLEKWDDAVAAFDQSLASEPDSYLARLFQSVALLKAARPAEAKIALTACIGQRPQVGWCRVFRSRVYLDLNDPVGAAQDLQFAVEWRINPALRPAFDDAMNALKKSIASLSADVREGFWKAEIQTGRGPQPIESLSHFERLRP